MFHYLDNYPPQFDQFLNLSYLSFQPFRHHVKIQIAILHLRVFPYFDNPLNRNHYLVDVASHLPIFLNRVCFKYSLIICGQIEHLITNHW